MFTPDAPSAITSRIVAATASAVSPRPERMSAVTGTSTARTISPIARSAARRATEAERSRFRLLAAGFEKAAKAGDDVAFMRIDRDFNVLCSAASHNEFAANAMSLMHALSRRFWYVHFQQAANMPQTAKLHADIARAIAARDESRAAEASDRLLDAIERFTRATVIPS